MNIFKKDKKENKEPTMVSCNDCKCLLYENDAQKIMLTLKFVLHTNSSSIYRYYCNTHKKNYEKVSYLEEEIYFKEMQVDEKGEPIGYKKIKQNENNKNN